MQAEDNQEGWQLLMEAGQQVIIAGPYGLILNSAQEQAVREYEQQLRCRIREFVPEAHLEIVQTVVLQVGLAIGYWTESVEPFLLRHGGEQLIQAFLADHPEWQMRSCPYRGEIRLYCSDNYHRALVEASQIPLTPGRRLIILEVPIKRGRAAT